LPIQMRLRGSEGCSNPKPLNGHSCRVWLGSATGTRGLGAGAPARAALGFGWEVAAGAVGAPGRSSQAPNKDSRNATARKRCIGRSVSRNTCRSGAKFGLLGQAAVKSRPAVGDTALQ